MVELTGVKATAGGTAHNLVIKNDGTVWAWGCNLWGQLGDGKSINCYARYEKTPIQVVGLTDVIAIAAGYHQSMALKKDGTVWFWGCDKGSMTDNYHYGFIENNNVPVPVSVLIDVVAITAGNDLSVALKDDGTAWYWGYGIWLTKPM